MSRRKDKSIIGEVDQVELAKTYVLMGARLSVLEAVTSLSKEKLSSLYKELHGKSPPKGQLPFSTDWYLGWQPNIHSSLFMGYVNGLKETSPLSDQWITAKAFRMYSEQVSLLGLHEVLTMTRAWRLTQFIRAGMLTMTPCKLCKGQFVADTYDLHNNLTCGLCKPPSRAGRGAGQSTSYLA